MANMGSGKGLETRGSVRTTARRFGALSALLLLAVGSPAALAAPGPADLQREFIRAVQTANVEAVQALIEQGLDPDAPMDAFDGMTPLVLTAMSGKAELLREVLAAGADVNRAAAGGMTPLEAGVASDDPVTVGLLLDAGAEVTEGIEFALKIAPGKNAARIQDLISRHGGSSRPGSGGGDEGPGDAPGTGEPDEGQESRAEAPEAEVIEASGTYPPGTYTGPCGSEFQDAPPKDTKPGDRGRSRSVATVFSDPLRESDEVDPDMDPEIARLLALAPLHEVKPPGCKPYEMGEGDYNVYVREVSQAWTWVCPGGADQCPFLRKEEEKPQATLRKAAQVKIRRASTQEDKDRPDVEITAPAEGAQFAFTGAGTGRFTIDATATVSPGRLASQVQWELEAVGGAKVTVNPPTGDQVQITVEGLPEKSADFGIKALTARIPGEEDHVSIAVFFTADERNHPGDRAGETPNWFHYWRQTSAGRDYAGLLAYRDVAPCSGGAQGNYFHDLRKILLYDKLYETSCKRRVRFANGKPVGPDPAAASTGIDCFGEVVRHEDVHRDELHYWWDGVETDLGTVAIPPTECGWPSLTRNLYRQVLGVDSDLDMVPDYIERGLAGCDPENPKSCPGRPFNDVGDVEMNAYRIGWKRWKRGSADTEDWSWCGKQWNDVSVCEGKRPW